MLENGFADMIVDRKNMRSVLAKILKMHNYIKADKIPGKDEAV